MQAGLPVLASINPVNDLIRLIEQERVGRVHTDQSVASLERLVGQLVDDIKLDADLPARCHALIARLFAPEAVVRQITVCLRLPVHGRSWLKRCLSHRRQWIR